MVVPKVPGFSILVFRFRIERHNNLGIYKNNSGISNSGIQEF
jgi:hypothetical protein